MFLACTVVLWNIGRSSGLTGIPRDPLPYFRLVENRLYKHKMEHYFTALT